MALEINGHTNLIEGTVYETKGATAMINSTIYEIENGRTLINGTGYDISFIKKIENIPSTSSSLTYTGSAQSPTWINYDSNIMTIGGSTSDTNAGSYTTTFTPKPGYCWSDGSTSAKSVTWKIGKAAGSVVIGNGSAKIVPVAISAGTTVTKSLALTVVGDGAISASSNNTSAATVSVSGSTLVVTNKYIGTSVITVNVAEGTNYTASSATVTYDATGTYYRVYFPSNYTTNPTYVHVLIDGVQYHTYRTELYVLSGTEVKAYSESKIANKYVTSTGSITLDGTSVNGSGNSARKYYYHNITSNTNFAIRTTRGAGTLFGTAYADAWTTVVAITTNQSGTVLNPPPGITITITGGGDGTLGYLRYNKTTYYAKNTSFTVEAGKYLDVVAYGYYQDPTTGSYQTVYGNIYLNNKVVSSSGDYDYYPTSSASIRFEAVTIGSYGGYYNAYITTT